jgi:Tol biopolymer transport system component
MHNLIPAVPGACNSARLVAVSAAVMLLAACNWTAILSKNVEGAQGDGESTYPAISADGTRLAYRTASTNVISGLTDPSYKFVLLDVPSGKVELFAVDANGDPLPGHIGGAVVSGDGRYVAFEHNLYLIDPIHQPFPDPTKSELHIYDALTHTAQRLTFGPQGDAGAIRPALSHDGRYVAFVSYADDVVPDDTNGTSDLFVHDRQTGNTVRASLATDGSEGGDLISSSPSLSADGRYVAFSTQSRLVPEDTSAFKWHDIFVRDLQAGNTTRVNVNSNGNGAFQHSYDPAISADGRYVAFMSHAANLVAGDTNETRDIFVHDRNLGETTRVSVDSDGNETTHLVGYSDDPSISANGRYVSFTSFATNLVENDTNGQRDIFVHDRHTGVTSRVNLSAMGNQANSHSASPYLTADGRYVVFSSYASNLAFGDANGTHDIFIRSVPGIEVDSVIPNKLPIGATTPVTVTGKNFLPGAFPVIHGGDKTISNIVRVDETTLTADVTVHPGAVSGARMLSVHLYGSVKGNFSGSAGDCAGCVTFF